MASKILIAPGKYVQGPDVLSEIGKHVASLGKKALVIGGPTALSVTKGTIEKSFADGEIEGIYEVFNGECCDSEINRLMDIAKGFGAEMIVGVGGGKNIDASKATGHYLKLPVVIVPTIAATDAPCSALSVVYSDDSIFDRYLVLPKNPDLVLVDSSIIAKAPVRLFVSGMGDALATWFEADACAKADANNIPGGKTTASALQLARLCYEILMEYGYQAKLAVEKGVVTPAVEKVIEANTLLSGLGFESSGLAAAHAVHNGLTALSETHHAYHGEKVAFGTIVQLVLENQPKELAEKVLAFCVKVGLPVCLADIGVSEIKPEAIREVAKLTCAEGDTMGNEPFEITPERVYSAIIGADALGADFKKNCGK